MNMEMKFPVLGLFALILLLVWVVHWFRRSTISASLKKSQQKWLTAREDLRVAKKALEQIENTWSLAFGRFAAIDTETTGKNAAEARTIQLAIVLFKNGKPVGKRDWLFNPGIPIPPNATKVNRITNDMVRTAPRLKSLLGEIKPLLERYPVVAHNLRYDTEVLAADFSRFNQSIKFKYGFCTLVRQFGKPNPEVFEPRTYGGEGKRRLKLAKLMETLGIEAKGELHDAYVDALAAGECFVAMARQEIANYENLVGSANRYLKACEVDLKEAEVRASDIGIQYVSIDNL
jgi:DNA polymerase III subunit epsilon